MVNGQLSMVMVMVFRVCGSALVTFTFRFPVHKIFPQQPRGLCRSWAQFGKYSAEDIISRWLYLNADFSIVGICLFLNEIRYIGN